MINVKSVVRIYLSSVFTLNFKKFMALLNKIYGGEETIYFIGTLIFLSLFIFFFGLVIISTSRKHLIITIIGLELALLGLSFLFIIYAILSPNITGNVVLFVLLTLGGAESALGLGLIMLYHNLKKSINLKDIKDLKF